MQEDRIIHILEREMELHIGEKVVGEIDWELRYARMQTHTGEHILSGVVNALYGFDNVGFHMNEKIMTVDFNGVLTAEDIKKIEIKANEAVYQNANVVTYYPAAEELAELEYRSKKELESAVRIVKILGEYQSDANSVCEVCVACEDFRSLEEENIEFQEIGKMIYNTSEFGKIARLDQIYDIFNDNGVFPEVLKEKGIEIKIWRCDYGKTYKGMD